MNINSNDSKKHFGNKRNCFRVRGLPKTKTGKTIGITSVAAPIVGFIINDLKKPDSMIRALIGKAATKLIERKKSKTDILDITEKVEISNTTEKNN